MTITSTLTSPTPATSEHIDDGLPTGYDADDVPVFRPAPRPTAVRISPYGPSDDVPTSSFERDFRRRLAELGAVDRSDAPAPRRSTITATVTALRSAIGVDRLLAVARALEPQDIADAYHHVARARSHAAEALDRVLAEPTVDRFEEEREVITPFFPQMAASLHRVASDHPDSFPAAVESLGEQIDVLDRSVDGVEKLIADNDPTWATKLAELDDGRNRGIYHHVCYRPRRVGDIVPVRLAYLLGDAKQDEGP